MKDNKELSEDARRAHALEKFREPPPGGGAVVGYDPEAEAEPEKGLRDHWYAIRQRLLLIILITALSTAAAAAYMARKPDIYDATARIQVDQESGPALSTSQSGSVVVNSPANDPEYFNTQLAILTGSGLLRRVVKTLDLEHNEEFLRPASVRDRSIWRGLRRMVGLRGDVGGRDQTTPKADGTLRHGRVAPAVAGDDLAEVKLLTPYVAAIRGGLVIDPVTNTRLIEVTYNHPDPQIAAEVVNAIADAYVVANFERMTQANATAGSFYQRRIAELQAQIRSGEERLIGYGNNHQILSLDPSQNTVVDRLTGLNRQLLEAENERKIAEAAYRATTASGAADAMAEAGGGQAAAAEAQLAALRQRLAQLLVENTEEWPEVKEIRQQMDVLEAQVKDARARATSVLLTNLQTRYQQTLAREQSLRAAFNQQRGATLAQNEAAVNYRIIQQEIQTSRTLLDGMLQRFRENDVVLAHVPNNVSVADYAVASGDPIGPRRWQGVGLASVISLGFGLGLAVLLGYRDDTLRTAEESERVLYLPTLALIPSVKSSARGRLLPALSILRPGKANGNGGGHTRPLITNEDSRSPFAEVYRKLRTSVLLASPGGAPKTLLVTSSLPAEGKTTTAINTALVFAQTGADVLLIDADVRNPSLHGVFDAHSRLGLSTILTLELSDDEIFATIHKDKESGLYVLNAGPEPPGPAELLGSDAMRKLLATLESRFSYIVIDSPPVYCFTDSVLVSSMVDAVLLVVQGEKISRAIVLHTRRVLHEVGANVLGVVLNNVNVNLNDNYYYYYHPTNN